MQPYIPLGNRLFLSSCHHHHPALVRNKSVIPTLLNIIILISSIKLSPSSSSVTAQGIINNYNPTNEQNIPQSFYGAADTLDLDDYNYSDQEYYQLAAEYKDNLGASFEEKLEELETERKAAEPRENQQEVSAIDQEEDGHRQLPSNDQKKEETFAEMASRLKCDNPWFWNAPRCTWIDVKARHLISRTKRNAETSAWFLGSIIGFVVVWLGGFCCFYQIKLKNRLKMQKLREKYSPGRIELPNGKTAQYQPTEEENKAYEELVKAIIIQEMSFMV